MNEDRIHSLLTDADVPPPDLPPGLAARVRRRERRGRRVRRGVAAGALLVGIGVALMFGMRWRRGDEEPISPGRLAGGDPVEVDDLAERIREKRRMIDALLAGERRAALARGLATYVRSPVMELDADRDRAAGALLECASDLRGRAGGDVRAGREYRRVIELFPDSPLALAAREGLKSMEN